MISINNVINNTLLQEYISESHNKPNKYPQLLNYYIPVQTQEYFKNKNVYSIATNPIIVNGIPIQLVVQKYNTDGVSVLIKTDVFFNKRELIIQRNNNMNFREFIKLSFYIQKKI